MGARSRFAGLAPNVQGAFWMLLAAFAFVAMNSLVKYLGPGYPAPLQNFYRQAAGFAVVLPFILRAPRAVLHSDRKLLLLGRAACGTAAMILQFYSYQHLPMAEANGLSFTRPLWIVPLAAFVLHERVGSLRVAAVAIGFGGVLVMLQPWSEHAHFGLAHGAALLSSLLLALSITGTKSLSSTHSTLTLLAWAAILGVVFTLPAAVLTWRWPSPTDFALLTAMGVFGIVNQGFFVKAMSVGDAAAMAPLDYTRLILSAGAGYLLFNETPSAMTWAGAGVIAGSTLYITWREQHLARRARTAAALGDGA